MSTVGCLVSYPFTFCLYSASLESLFLVSICSCTLLWEHGYKFAFAPTPLRPLGLYTLGFCWAAISSLSNVLNWYIIAVWNYHIVTERCHKVLWLEMFVQEGIAYLLVVCTQNGSIDACCQGWSSSVVVTTSKDIERASTSKNKSTAWLAKLCWGDASYWRGDTPKDILYCVEVLPHSW